MPNLVKKTVIDPKTGKRIVLYVTARAIRTMAKNPGKFSKQIALIAKKDLKKKSK